MSGLPVLQFPPPPGALGHLPPEVLQPAAGIMFTPTSEDGDDRGSSDNGLPPDPPSSTRWFFEKEKLEDTPSRKSGMDWDKELTLRQQSANFIQDIGQRLQVNQLCINTAIVYMHRFYMYHSFTLFPKNAISTASIFLAAKVEEQPRKLEYVIKIAHYCLYRDTLPPIDVKSETYAVQSSELVSNENILLQTLGFDVSVDHPHTHVVKCCQLVRASKDLAQTSYFMATNSLHLTTMCLKYQPSVVACVCIHLSCKWSNWEIPRSKEGREWYYYVDETVTPEKLDALTSEFLTVFNKSPARLKKKILSLSAATSGGAGGSGGALTNFPTHFTLDKNSAGVQTIKSRSRSPSPVPPQPQAGANKPRPPALPGAPKLPTAPVISPTKPVKPVAPPLPPQVGGQPHHFGNKPAPGPYPGMDKRPHVGLPPKPQFPHQQPQQPVPHPHSTAHHVSKEAPHHVMKPAQPYPMQHPLSNGVHGPYHGNRPQHHPVPHHSAAPTMGSHSHPPASIGSHSHPAPKQNLGSQPNHHFPPKPSQHAPPPPGHPMYNKQHPMQSRPPFPHPTNATGTQAPAPNSNITHKEGYVRPGGQTQAYQPHLLTSSNGGHGQYPYQHGNRSMHPHAPPHPAHPSAAAVLPTQAQLPSLSGPRPLMASHVPQPESLKRRQPEPAMAAGGRPMPNMPLLKRPRQEGVNQFNLSSVTPSVEEVLKQEPAVGAKKPFYPPHKNDVRLEAPEQAQAAPPSLMPALSYNTFPLLSSEFAGTKSATSNYRSDIPPTLVPQVKPAIHAFPQLTNSMSTPVRPIPATTASSSSSSDPSNSAKKKKKKKEHKHKKDRDDKERHKEKHKKDKHREKEAEKHKPSKDKPSKDKHHHRNNHDSAGHVKESKLKIKTMPAKDPKENKHVKKPFPSVTTVYY